MKQEFGTIPLSDISLSKTNEIFRSAADFKEDLGELIDSIRQQGVLQPILVRPNGSAGKYELVGGERRYRACLAIQKAERTIDTIPALIRELSDAEAFDAQVTENLQRKDVHPLKEAKGYAYLMKQNKLNTTAELAKKFGKGETYILQRLKLNDLIPAAAADFESNAMSLGHALLIARLEPADQEAVVKRLSNTETIDKVKVKYYDSIHELEDFISENIIQELSKAPFDTKDPDVVPKAGPCTTCPKRSGCQPLLFNDIKEKDRCMDPACFKAKITAGVLKKVKELVEAKPDTMFAEDYSYNGRDKVDPRITAFLSSNAIKALTHDKYESYSSSYNKMTKKVSAFLLNGDSMGHFKTIYIKSDGAKESNPKSAEKIDIKAAIAGIQERTKRAAELDEEKVYVEIIAALQKSPAYKQSAHPTDRHEPIDTIMERFMIIESGGYSARDILQKFKINATPRGDAGAATYLDAIGKLSDKDFLQITRLIMIKNFAGQATAIHSPAGQLLRRSAIAYGEVPVKLIDQAQAEVRAKREVRAKERIAQLQPLKDLKPATKAKAAPAAKKKAKPKTGGGKTEKVNRSLADLLDTEES